MTAIQRAALLAVHRDGYRSASEFADLAVETVETLEEERLLDTDAGGHLHLTAEGREACASFEQDEE